jgi:CRP/FNR family transcriptional regulator, cyclic AMP receptor protein
MTAPLPARETLFSGFPAALADALLRVARPVRLAAGQMLFLAGDAGDGCYLVIGGLLKVTAVSSTGSERILAILGPGAMVGELAMIDGAPRSNTVAALRETELHFVGRADFHAFADRHPEVYRHIVIALARRLRDTNEVVAAASFLSLKGRVARSLLSLAEAFGHEVGPGRMMIRQKVTQSDLAAMSGIARENVSRILNDWKRRKLVSRVSAYYCLENRSVLEDEARL